MSKTYHRRKSSNRTRKSLKKRSVRKSLKTSIKRVRFSEKIQPNSRKSDIVKMFLEVLNMIKLYHWKTHSFSQHKATDELYGRISENTDKFIEVLMGKDQSRIQMIESKIDLIDPNKLTDFKDRIYKFREFLENMNIYFDKHNDTDLLNIRDEMLSDINQFLYLLSMNK
jgi:hypothetical protein